MRSLGNELPLNFRGEHQVPVSLSLGRQGCEDSSADPKVSGAHMRAFLDSVQAERNSSKVLCIHGRYFLNDFYRDRVVAVAGRNTSWSFGEKARLRTNVVLTKHVMDDAEKIIAITTN